MTTRWDYWNGPDEQDRRERYVEELTPEVEANGADVQRRIEAVIAAYLSAGGSSLPGGYASGWRPQAVNEATANAGKKSTHITAQAGDVRDTPDGSFAWWCMRNRWALEAHGLWMEHAVATVVRAWATARAQGREPTPWCHLQSVPPGSHNRVYMPDSRAPAEWDALLAAGGQEGMGYGAWTLLAAPGRDGAPAGQNATPTARQRHPAKPRQPAADKQGPGEDA